MSAISLDQVSIVRGGRTLVEDVTLNVATGSWLSLIGPNGAGKTTLLRSIAGATAYSGCIELAGRDNALLHPAERARLLAVVPQHPVIPPGMQVFDYVLLGRTPYQRVRCSPSKHDRSRGYAVLQRLDLDDMTGRRVDTLSGGERQRVVLARALVQETPVLALDEPTSALDVGHQLEVLELIAGLRAERVVTVVTTVHDLSIAGQFADTIAIMSAGRLVSAGTPKETLTEAIINEHWGVEAKCAVDTEGAVTVTVHRRRELREAIQA